MSAMTDVSTCTYYIFRRASLAAQMVMNPPTWWETWVQSRKTPWRREWLPTPVFWPGEFHGERSLAGYGPRGCRESDTTERLSLIFRRLVQTHGYKFLTCVIESQISISGVDLPSVCWMCPCGQPTTSSTRPSRLLPLILALSRPHVSLLTYMAPLLSPRSHIQWITKCCQFSQK